MANVPPEGLALTFKCLVRCPKPRFGADLEAIPPDDFTRAGGVYVALGVDISAGEVDGAVHRGRGRWEVRAPCVPAVRSLRRPGLASWRPRQAKRPPLCPRGHGAWCPEIVHQISSPPSTPTPRAENPRGKRGRGRFRPALPH